MVPYPGTEIYNMIKRNEGGYKLISHDWSDFNKQVGNALELENINRRELEKLQLQAYMKFYLYNYRLLDLIKIGIKERNTLYIMLKKLLKIWRKMNKLILIGIDSLDPVLLLKYQKRCHR